jgi:hypothetical protein
MWGRALLVCIMLGAWTAGWFLNLANWTVRDAWLSGYVTGTLATVVAFVVHRALRRR